MVVRCDGGAGRTIKQANHNAERNCSVFFRTTSLLPSGVGHRCAQSASKSQARRAF